MAFLVGNMVGQHGWYVFWRSVWGEGTDQYIAYTGVVTPIDKVPDYVRWAKQYGGDPHLHTYKQVPQDLLVPLPPYDAALQHAHLEESDIGQVYSVGHNGSYRTGGDNDGSHPGVDIRVPIGTPVRSIANGVVDSVKDDTGGFGIVVVVRHPNAPDPDNPRRITTLYSVYAHLSAALVDEGMVVQKGDRIALSGDTGFASGPHLHFQMDRSDAPWHPYWPFSTADIRGAGLGGTAAAVNAGLGADNVRLYTVHPMLYVQSNPSPRTVVASSDAGQGASSSRSSVPSVRRSPAPTLANRITRLQDRVSDRAASRLSRQRFATANRSTPVAQPNVLGTAQEVTVTNRNTVVSTDVAPVVPVVEPAPEQPESRAVHAASIRHDGAFSGRGWETVTVSLLDADGNVVSNPAWGKDLYLRTAYGDAEFRPVVLKASDFTKGEATVQMLPRGRRTVVIQLQPLGAIAKPMVYSE